ncbi:unnamed protein product, partial [Mesorhabditis belari]|uniref:Uncharacterized protein n=1 Tax=Mesorhabditis belari TaxID=2138241 RepID=A0AAF3EI05_9BILA
MSARVYFFPELGNFQDRGTRIRYGFSFTYGTVENVFRYPHHNQARQFIVTSTKRKRLPPLDDDETGRIIVKGVTLLDSPAVDGTTCM